jgi:excisionase family DNA binding protein
LRLSLPENKDDLISLKEDNASVPLSMRVIEALSRMEGLLTVKQVASLLAVHEMTVYGWTKAGTMPHLRVGSRLKFDPAAVAEWLGARQVG